MPSTQVWSGAVSGSLTTAGNWESGVAPVAGDNVIFRPGPTYYPTSNLQGLNNAALSGALAAVIFAEGWQWPIGLSTSYLQFTCTRLDVWSTGALYVDVEASAMGPQIFNTAVTTAGRMGLYLRGSAITTLVVQGGSVYIGGAAYTVGEARAQGSNSRLYLGSGLNLTTSYAMDGATITQQCPSTTAKARDGNLITEEVGAITTATLYGRSNGKFNSSGIITTLNVEDDESFADFTGSAENRTVTNTNWKRGRMEWDPAVMTFTNAIAIGLAGRVVRGRLGNAA